MASRHGSSLRLRANRRYFMGYSLGIDVAGIYRPDSLRFPWASSGRLSLVQRCARSLMQPANSLPYWPGYGFDVRAHCGSNAKPSDVARGIEQQFERFEGVERAVADVTRNTDGSLGIRCQIEDAEGPFEFVMSATEAAVKLISIWGESVTNG